MPVNENLPVVPFPMTIYWNEVPKTNYIIEDSAFEVELLDYPKDNFRNRCAVSAMSTWNYNPIELTQEQANKIFLDILQGKMLPNSLESLIFTFRFKNLTHIEISHILRHRNFFSIHAVCSGDRDLRHDRIMIPKSILKSKYKQEYIQLSFMCKDLYAKMVDEKIISLMDARYILTRNHCYDYIISMNLKDAIAFINQRKCTQVQPKSDNIIARNLYLQLIRVIPELSSIISMECDKSCNFIKNIENNTRLYQPDEIHSKLFEYNRLNFLYNKTRDEM